LKVVAESGGFYSYIAGVAAFMLEYYDVGGVSIDCHKVTIPIQKGLSSSACVCVLVARAFNLLYNLNMTVRSEMEAAYRGEIMTPSRCGRLDQACAYGTRPVVMRFASENIEVDRLAVGKDLYWVFADLKGNKDTKKILTDLNACFPYPRDATAENVHLALGTMNQQIVEYVVEAMKVGDAAKIGALMTEAQKVFDEMVAPACPSELTSPLLHALLNDSSVKKMALGGKGVGSQGDGTVQFICENEVAQHMLCEYLREDKGLDSYVFTIRAQHSVKKAIIPVAGYGTRLFPATKVIKKEFMPIVDFDGMLKPALLILLDELEKAGIEEIGLIIKPGDRAEYEKLFVRDLDLEHYRRLPQKMRDYQVRIQSLGRKITYIEQKEQLGFGHAVYQARAFAGDEPILLCLGDHLYYSELDENCAAQLINAYERSGMLTIGIDECKLEQVQHYGILAGEFIDDEFRMMQVREMKEKPTVDYAQEYLGTEDKKCRTKFYCAFGQYVLTPKVLELLGRNVDARTEGEVGLTEVLNEIRADEGMIGYKVDGKRFDVGIPEAYKESLSLYGSEAFKDSMYREIFA
jgi:UTP-glucose-1-phosphate uridylyltransferase/mevalonate kinase